MGNINQYKMSQNKWVNESGCKYHYSNITLSVLILIPKKITPNRNPTRQICKVRIQLMWFAVNDLIINYDISNWLLKRLIFVFVVSFWMHYVSEKLKALNSKKWPFTKSALHWGGHRKGFTHWRPWLRLCTWYLNTYVMINEEIWLRYIEGS